MRLPVAIALVVIGVVLLVMGLSASDSVASDVSRLFTGKPTDRAVWLIIGGLFALIVGAGTAFTPLGSRKA